MSYGLPDLAVTGEIIPAAWGNQNRDNWAASAVGLATAAGEVPYATGDKALAMLSIGATAKIFQVVGGLPAWSDPPGWHIAIDARVGGDSNVNWTTRSVPPSNSYSHYIKSSGVQNDEIVFNNILLTAGTWSVYFATMRRSICGIISVQFDGVEKGTYDAYNASDAAIVASVTGIAVAATARIALKFKMTSKNASASSYDGYLAAVSLRRTA